MIRRGRRAAAARPPASAVRVGGVYGGARVRGDAAYPCSSSSRLVTSSSSPALQMGDHEVDGDNREKVEYDM